MPHALALGCHRSDCRFPWAHIYNGVMTVESRHEGNRHVNAVSLDILLKLLKGSRYTATVEDMEKLLAYLNLPMVEPVLIEIDPSPPFSAPT